MEETQGVLVLDLDAERVDQDLVNITDMRTGQDLGLHLVDIPTIKIR